MEIIAYFKETMLVEWWGECLIGGDSRRNVRREIGDRNSYCLRNLKNFAVKGRRKVVSPSGRETRKTRVRNTLSLWSDL